MNEEATRFSTNGDFFKKAILLNEDSLSESSTTTKKIVMNFVLKEIKYLYVQQMEKKAMTIDNRESNFDGGKQLLSMLTC